MSRSLPRCFAVCVLLCGVVGCSKERAQEEEKRELLMPKVAEKREQLQKALEERRVLDDKNELLASEETVAGLLLPRGLTLVRTLEREWYYSTERASPAALERYFTKLLFNTQVERSTASVKFVGSKLKSDATAPPVTVRIDAVSGTSLGAALYIKQAGPAQRRASGAEVEAQLQARRKYAD